MPYRQESPRPPPRRLVIHPQRGPACAALVVMGAMFLGLAGFGAQQRDPSVVPLSALAVGGLVVFGLGLQGLLRSVEFSIDDERGLVRVTWRSRLRPTRWRELALPEIRDVVLDEREECVRVAVLWEDQVITLTDSWTSDRAEVEAKVAEIRAFLGISARSRPGR